MNTKKKIPKIIFPNCRKFLFFLYFWDFCTFFGSLRSSAHHRVSWVTWRCASQGGAPDCDASRKMESLPGSISFWFHYCDEQREGHRTETSACIAWYPQKSHIALKSHSCTHARTGIQPAILLAAPPRHEQQVRKTPCWKMSRASMRIQRSTPSQSKWAPVPEERKIAKSAQLLWQPSIYFQPCSRDNIAWQRGCRPCVFTRFAAIMRGSNRPAISRIHTKISLQQF